MARIRNLKPEFFDSPDTADADLAVRLTFLAMWCWADDSGKGTANLKELEAFAWPNDEVTELPRGSSRTSVTVWPNFGHILAEVQRCYGVVFYKVDRRPYYWIPSFKANQARHFKPESKLPSADEGEPWDLTSEYADHGDGVAELRPHCDRTSVTPWPNSAAHVPLDRDRDRDRDGDTPLTPRAEVPVPSRPPRGGAEVAERLNSVAVSAAAHTIISRYEQWSTAPVTGTDRKKLGDAIDECTQAGYDQDRIEAGIRAWSQSDSWSPTQVPAFVRKQATPRDGPVTSKAQGWADITNQLAQEDA